MLRCIWVLLVIAACASESLTTEDHSHLVIRPMACGRGTPDSGVGLGQHTIPYPPPPGSTLAFSTEHILVLYLPPGHAQSPMPDCVPGAPDCYESPTATAPGSLPATTRISAACSS